ncbi:diphthine synthase [Candidatus Micrarchaeota archaeon]|nr:diphthine synthase [Candidatus Micrarchaeota archaeon]MBU1166638.1 diphthine synthase [Candidatus Micrarchaeota archaeon]MBU1886595.1 diphthine synthase [Candidatus Micrarchaeota archaeon]
MILTLIGAGISFDLTLSSVDALKKADKIYIETYTGKAEKEIIEFLEKLTGKEIILLPREKVESNFLIKEATQSNICIISLGDPLIATTHTVLIIEAKKAGIEVNVIHNSSVYTAAPGKSGLQIYRFGKTASLVNPRPNYKPTSSLDIIRKNLENNMHSLVLLDTEPEPMEARAALEMLNEFDSAVVLSRLGYPDEKITYGKIIDLLETEPDLGKPLFCIIIPAQLHPLEDEFLALYTLKHQKR